MTTKSTYLKVLEQAASSAEAMDNLRVEIDEIKTGVSEGLFKAAKASKDNVDTFLSHCEQAEGQYKEESGAKRLPDSWRQAKSNIKQSLSIGLKPADFKHEYDMRQKLNELRKQAKKAGIDTKDFDKPEAIEKAASEVIAKEDTPPTGELQERFQKLAVLVRQIEVELGHDMALGVLNEAVADAESVLTTSGELGVIEEVEDYDAEAQALIEKAVASK